MSTQSRARASRRSGSPLTPYLFLFPYLLIFATFVVVPAVFGIWISLHDWDYMLDSKICRTTRTFWTRIPSSSPNSGKA